ncbi:ParB/RepB/Spo0J family partition protein [Conchiformibius steedae]|uniref:ParB/RepB/Spo0J family partition protein n=1 Tax=Conchiformibius steedae TaxID=153493 RepID=A0A3P2A2N2_9NEIS|nr:ParB/RepB/Spo0J family partition protein [Conchiformibius steedae]RRD89235.1 ParB/RepB/Spo0J family partition protein [Conchiformibius steedae]
MSKNIKALLSKKLAENNSRHLLAQQDTEWDRENRLLRLPLDKIQANPFQPRLDFDEQELNALAESIKEMGLLQAITVRETERGEYQIIAGERRLQACKRLGKTTIDAVLMQVEDSELAILALAENVDRQDLSDFEIGKALREIEKLFPNKTRLAEAVGLNRSDMYRYFSFEALPPVLWDKLTQRPRLLSRTAMTQIRQTLEDLALPEAQSEAVLLKAWALLESGALEQSKMAAYIRQQVTCDDRKQPAVAVKPILLHGQSVGTIQHKGKKLVVEIKRSVLSAEQEQKIEAFFDRLMAKD